MVTIIPKLTQNLILFAGLAFFDISIQLNNDTYFFAGLAAFGALCGSFARLVRRDKADIDNKIKYVYVKDVFEIFVWTLVGGFFPLAFASVGWLPGLGVIISPFMPKAFDFMEDNLPQAVLGTVLKTGKLIETFIESRNGGGKHQEKNETETQTKEETK